MISPSTLTFDLLCVCKFLSCFNCVLSYMFSKWTDMNVTCCLRSAVTVAETGGACCRMRMLYWLALLECRDSWILDCWSPGSCQSPRNRCRTACCCEWRMSQPSARNHFHSVLQQLTCEGTCRPTAMPASASCHVQWPQTDVTLCCLIYFCIQSNKHSYS